MKNSTDRVDIRINVPSALNSFLEKLADAIGISKGSLIVVILSSYIKKEWSTETNSKKSPIFLPECDWSEDFKNQLRYYYTRYSHNNLGESLFHDKLSAEIKRKNHIITIRFRMSYTLYSALQSDSYRITKDPTKNDLSLIPINAGIIQSILLYTMDKFGQSLENLPDIEVAFEKYQNTLQLATSEMNSIAKLYLLYLSFPNIIHPSK